jgi:DNA polymerase-3 subunit beta
MAGKNGSKTKAVKEAPVPRFVMEPAALQKALAQVVRAVDAKPQLPVLANVRLTVDGDSKEIELSATNLSLTVVARIPCPEASASWTTTIPSRQGHQLISNINPLAETEFSYQADSESVFIKQLGQSRSRFSLRGIAAADFPKIEELDEERSFSFDAETLCEALANTMYAASGDYSKPMLVGVTFLFEEGQIKLVATDTYRIAWVTLPIEEDYEDTTAISIPANTLREVERLFASSKDKVTLSIGTTANGSKRAVFRSGLLMAQVMLLDEVYDRFSAVEKALSDLPVAVEVRVSTLKAALRRTQIFAADDNLYCTLKFSDEGVEVESRSAERGEATELVEAESKNPSQALVIGQSVRVLLEALEPFDGCRFVTVEGKNEGSMLRFSSDEKREVNAAASPMNRKSLASAPESIKSAKKAQRDRDEDDEEAEED